MRPRVTVLTTVRNGERYLEEALESIKAQTMTDWEHIIVDDASDDDTPSIIERYTANDARFRSLRLNVSRGTYAAANRGLPLASGRHIARLDADDIAMPHRLERQVRFLSERPSLRACAADVIVLDGGREHTWCLPATPTLPGSLKWGLCFRGFLPSTALVETAAMLELGGYRELPVLQDHRLWCELAQRRWFAAIPEPLAYWRVHEGQLSVQRSELQHRLHIDVLRDHLRALTGEDWSDDDVRAMRYITQPSVSFAEGKRILDRFDALWNADGSLDAQEKGELRRLTKRVRHDHARSSAREKLGSFGGGRLALRIYRQVKAQRS